MVVVDEEVGMVHTELRGVIGNIDEGMMLVVIKRELLKDIDQGLVVLVEVLVLLLHRSTKVNSCIWVKIWQTRSPSGRKWTSQSYAHV
jgi:hypothetical protein